MRLKFQLILTTVSCVFCLWVFCLHGDEKRVEIEAFPTAYDSDSFVDPADVPPSLEAEPATSAVPRYDAGPTVAPAHRMRLRLLRSDDMPSGAANFSRGMYIDCSAVEMQANVSNGKSKYEFKCAGPIELRHGRTMVSGSSAEYSRGRLRVHDAKIFVASDGLRMAAKEFQINYEVIRFTVTDSASNATETVSTVSN